MEKEPRPKKYFFVAMSPAQNANHPVSKEPEIMLLDPIYFRLRIVCLLC
jgi:hypothetical protein